MPALIYPNSGSLWLAAIVKTALALSTMHLYQTGSVVLSAATTKAELVAAVANYTGYALQTITAWFAPLLNPLGGASIESGLLQFQIDAPYTVDNVIQGWWVEDAGNDLVCAGDFTTPKALVGAGDGIPFNVELIFGG